MTETNDIDPGPLTPDGTPVRKVDRGAVSEAGLFGKVVNAGGFAFAMAICVAAGILLLEVFLRYVLNSPTIWAHETTTFLCGISFLYGGLYCASRNTHIRVVLIYDMLPRKARRLVNIFISFASFIAAGFFTYAAWIMSEKAFFTPVGDFRMERSGSAWNPPTPALVKGFLLVVMILMTVQFLILTWNYIRRAAEETN
ncbi:TRAP transporter small permease subunit [Tropicimonas sp. IMCC6043]|uniref:TRAP transporter small permease subunit n=1 Tax=Tropicimonas sp. IMCC6043 TaxID=2510645 RepID=UPI00101D4EF6|nr:TRAP transporter small permease [Tropicimonas sp. IMCC6043]RYH12307.1 TRAP transporter small permease [Tropicimonas sp. IMCC6043]